MSIPRKIFPGGRPDRSSRTRDDMVDAIDAVRAEQDAERLGNDQFVPAALGTMAHGMNFTGSDIPQYGVVRFGVPRAYHGGSIDEDNFKNTIYLNTQLSEGKLDEIIGIAQIPVRYAQGPSYAVGRFLIDGVTQCKIKYSKEEEDGIGWATGEDGEVGFLVPDVNGQVEILWHEPMTWGSAAAQTVWALVRLTSGTDAEDFVHFELKYDLAYDTLAGTDAYVLTWDAENNQWDTPEVEDDVIKVVDFNVDDDKPLRGCAGKANLAVLARGTRGIAKAKQSDDGTVYEIVQLFHKARFIEFYLNEAMAVTDANKTAIVMVRGAKRMFWDGIDPDPAGSGFEVYNALLDAGVYLYSGESGDSGYAVYDEHDDKYWIVLMKQEDRDHWAKADSDWNENGAACAKVSVKPCDADGTVEDDPVPDSFDVFLPRNRTKIKANDYDPDIYADDIILWRYTEDGTKVCASTYLTSKIGDFRWQDAATRIQTGWKPCDDDGGADAPNVRGRALVMFDADDALGDGSETTVGQSVGEYKHGDTDNSHAKHGKDSVADCIAEHTAADVAQAIADHADHGKTGSYGGENQVLCEPPAAPQHSVHAAGAKPLSHVSKAIAVDLDHDATDNRGPRYTAVLVRRYK